MPLTRIKNTAIGDGGISTAKLADGAVTTVKLGNDSVNSAKIGVDVIAAVDLAANSVETAEISAGAVTGAKLANNLDYDSGLLYLDSTNDRIGIGTTSPQEKLQVSGAVMATGTAINTPASSTTIDISSNVSRFISAGPDSSTVGSISLNAESDNASIVYQPFHSDVSGNVSLGSRPVAIPVTIDSSLAGIAVNSSGSVVNINNPGNGATLKLTDPAAGANRGFAMSLQNVTAIVNNSEAGPIVFGTGNAERARLTNTNQTQLSLYNTSPPATGQASLVAGDRTILGDVVNYQSLFSNNAYYDGTTWRYYRNDEYSSIRMFDGKIYFHTGNAGTAGNQITNIDGYERRVTIDGTQNGGSSRTQMYVEDSYLVSHARNVYFAENSTPQYVTTGWVDTALSLNNVFIPNHVRVMPFWLYGTFRNNGMTGLNHTGFRLRVTGGSISGSAYIGDGGWGFGIHQLVGSTIGTNWNTFCNHVNLLDFDVNNNQAGLTAGSTYNFTVQVKDAYANGSDLVIAGEANAGQATYAPFNCTLIIV